MVVVHFFKQLFLIVMQEASDALSRLQTVTVALKKPDRLKQCHCKLFLSYHDRFDSCKRESFFLVLACAQILWRV